ARIALDRHLPLGPRQPQQPFGEPPVLLRRRVLPRRRRRAGDGVGLLGGGGETPRADRCGRRGFHHLMRIAWHPSSFPGTPRCPIPDHQPADGFRPFSTNTASRWASCAVIRSCSIACWTSSSAAISSRCTSRDEKALSTSPATG